MIYWCILGVSKIIGGILGCVRHTMKGESIRQVIQVLVLVEVGLVIWTYNWVRRDQVGFSKE